MYVFYIRKAGEYYKACISADSKELAQSYLEGISDEVRYKNKEEPKTGKYGSKEIPCGELLQYSYYGSIPPRGLEIDRRHHRA